MLSVNHISKIMIGTEIQIQERCEETEAREGTIHVRYLKSNSTFMPD